MENVINQIKNLLNKTIENGCSEAEAATAAGIAQKLLTKHRLTLTEIQTEKSKFDERFKYDPFEIFRNVTTWRSILLHNICEVNGCKSLIRHDVLKGKRISYFTIIGTEEDSKNAQAFYLFLRDAIESLAKMEQAVHGGRGKSWANSWKLGCTNAVVTRLREANKEAKEESVGSAIVRLDNQDKELQNWIGQNMKVSQKKTAPSKINANAYFKGVSAGQGMNLNGKVIE